MKKRDAAAVKLLSISLIFLYLVSAVSIHSQQPSPRAGHTLTAVNNDIFLFGGYSPKTTNTGSLEYNNSNNLYNGVYKWDNSNFFWTKMDVSGSQPPSVFGHTGTDAGDNDLIIFTGGATDENSPLNYGNIPVFFYSAQSNWWTNMTSTGTAPSPRYYHSAVVINNYLYIAGGIGLNGAVLNDCWRLELVSPYQNWEQMASMPVNLWGQAAAETEDNKIVLWGGKKSSGAINTEVYGYNTGTNIWGPVMVSSFENPAGRTRMASTSDGYNLWVLGGEADGSAKKDVWKYNFSSSIWTQEADLPDVRSGTAVAIIPEEPEKKLVYGGMRNGIAVGDPIKYPVEQNWTLTIEYGPEEAMTSGGCYVTKNPDKDSYGNEDVTLQAFEAGKWEFQNWLGDLSGSDNPATITMNSDKNVTAVFNIKSYSLTIGLTPEGSGSVTRSPDQDEYEYGTPVNLTAIANDGYEFEEWAEGISDEDKYKETVTIEIDEPKSISVKFRQIPYYSLTTNVFPSDAANAGCSISAAPDLTQYEEGSSISVTANAISGWQFVEWTGSVTGSNNPQTIIMDSDKSVTAVFSTKAQRTLNISMDPPEAAENGCSTTPEPGTYQKLDGDVVQFSVTDNPTGGWFFDEWTGVPGDVGESFSLEMDQDYNAVANYINVSLTVSGPKVKKTICPDSAFNGAYIMQTIRLTASQDDDWNVFAINLKPSGTGDDYVELDLVYLSDGRHILYTGVFPGDDETLRVAFTPALEVARGQTITLIVFYSFKFDSHYASDEKKTFHLATDGITAEPVNFDTYAIIGSAESDTLTIARVFNSEGNGFTTISEAITSGSTRNGDTCFVCPGNYYEKIDISKEITLTSVTDEESTSKGSHLYPKSNTDPYLLNLNSDNIKIEELNFHRETNSDKIIWSAGPVSGIEIKTMSLM